MSNHGQTCIASDYVFVHESVSKEFLEQLIGGLKNDLPFLGRKVVSKNHYERVCGLLANHGGEVVFGNGDAHKDMRLTPTVIVNPSKDSALMKEEIFGPILPVKIYTDLQEVVDYVNEREKPLVTYFFGEEEGEACKRLS